MAYVLVVKPDMLVAPAVIRINPENIYMPPALCIVGRDAFPVKIFAVDDHVPVFLAILLPVLTIPQKLDIFVAAGPDKRIFLMKNTLLIIKVPGPGFSRQRRRNRMFRQELSLFDACSLPCRTSNGSQSRPVSNAPLSRP